MTTPADSRPPKEERAESARDAVDAVDEEGLVAPDGVNEQGVLPESTGE